MVTPFGVVNMSSHLVKLMSEYARDASPPAEMIGLNGAIGAFGSLTDMMWKDEAGYVDFENSIRGMTEEEFDELYADDKDAIPLDNLLPSAFRDLRILRDFFSNSHPPSEVCKCESPTAYFYRFQCVRCDEFYERREVTNCLRPHCGRECYAVEFCFNCHKPSSSDDEGDDDGDDDGDDEGDEGDDGDDGGWETIYNENFREWQRDGDGARYLIFQTCGGGPAGGYIAYPDGTLFTWRQNWGTGKERTRLRDQSLRIRRSPDIPANYDGAQGLQVKACAEEVGDSVFDYVELEPESYSDIEVFFLLSAFSPSLFFFRGVMAVATQ